MRTTTANRNSGGNTATDNAIAKAEAFARTSERSKLSFWFGMYEAYLVHGKSVDAFAKYYPNSQSTVSNHGSSAVSNSVSAIKRAVAKYKSPENARKAFEEWAADKYEGGKRRNTAGITEFIKWAPEGQRSKNATTKPKAKRVVNTRTMTSAEHERQLVKQLVSAGLPKVMAVKVAKDTTKALFVA